jgi:hypothetical protein
MNAGAQEERASIHHKPTLGEQGKSQENLFTLGNHYSPGFERQKPALFLGSKLKERRSNKMIPSTKINK